MVKRIIKCVKEYKKYAIFTSLFVSLEVILEVFIPLIMSKLIDNGIEKGNMEIIIRLGSILVIISLISLVCGVLSGKFAAIAACGFAKNLRKEVYYKVQDFSFSNIDKFKTSSLITRLTTDITNIQQAFQMIIRVAVRAPMMLVFSLFMAFTINKKVSIIFVFAILFLGTGLYFIMTKVHPLFKKTFETYDVLNNVVEENLRGIKTVKSYVRENFEDNKFKNISNEVYNNFTGAEKIVICNMPLMQFTMYMCILLISFVGSKLIIANGMTRGELISLVSYTGQILVSLMILSGTLVMLLISQTSQERVYEVLSEKIDLGNIDNPVTEMKDGDIEFKNVNFGYRNGDNYCLKDVNLHIKSGESVGIIGSTGSSKSTLVQLIPRLYDVSSGEILVGGVNVKDYDIKVLRDNIAVVFQKNTLFSGTVKENLCMGNKNATQEEIENACKIACATEFIEKLEGKYEGEVKQEGSNFSGGQKQRLCIARALIKNPKIIILDDSTSAVDMKTDAVIRKGLSECMPNTTKLIISQRIMSIASLDKILVMEDGKVADFGTHDELLKTCKIYKELYTSQMKGDSNNAE